MNINNVFQIVDRPKVDSKGRKPNILGARWVLKTKIDSEYNTTKKARLVIQGFRDSNTYD